MNIKSIRIQHFRAFEDVQIPFEGYTCLVGPNGAGKSTVLCALNVFFRASDHSPTDLTSLEVEDFHNKDVSKPIQITVSFANLDSAAQEDFKDYYRNGELTITAKASYDAGSQTATVRHHGQRLAMEPFAPFFQASGDGKSVAELKSLYARLQARYPALPKAGTKDAMKEALRAYETEHPGECVLIPSEDQFYGVSKGANRLAKHIQWVYVPAVKDAISEEVGSKDSALGKLVERVVSSKGNLKEEIHSLRQKAQQDYDKLLAQNQPVLAEVSKQLETLVARYAHPDAKCKIEWFQDPDKSVRVEDPLASLLAGEGQFQGGLARFGHGLQRSLLLGLLQLVAGVADESGPKLLLGCEEPELFQHPPQARHLAEVFQKLSGTNAQVVVSTHSPYFVVSNGFEGVRLVRKERGSSFSEVTHTTFAQAGELIAKATGKPAPKKPEGTKARLHMELQPNLNETFFSPIVVLVEGLEDVAYITSHLMLSGKWDDFRRLGCHLVPANGKSHMAYPMAVMNLLKIPCFAVWDADSDAKEGHRGRHIHDNRANLVLCGAADLEPFPVTHVFASNHTVWTVNMGQAVEEDLRGEEWEKCKTEARTQLGDPGALEKNSLFIADSLERAREKGLASRSLESLCSSILAFAAAPNIATVSAESPVAATT